MKDLIKVSLAAAGSVPSQTLKPRSFACSEIQITFHNMSKPGQNTNNFLSRTIPEEAAPSRTKTCLRDQHVPEHLFSICSFLREADTR